MEYFPRIQAVHKPEAVGFKEGNIIVEEKVDGSQIRIEINDKGEISVGSHNVDNIHIGSSDGFKKAIDTANTVFEGVKADPNEVITVFAEFLSKPKQNTIPYARVPNQNVVIFDVIVNGYYLDREEKERFGFRIGLEVVPLLWKGKGEHFTDEIRESLLKTPSFLGHQAGYDKIEGIVIKNYGKLFDPRFRNLEGKHMVVKIVNSSFQEKNKVENPGQGDKVEELINSLCSIPRWNKTIQHLREDGLLKDHMRDLALIVPGIVKDIEEEEKESIKEELYKIYMPKIKQRCTRGLPEHYMKVLEERGKYVGSQ